MSFVAALWQGQIPLVRTAWLYGGGALIALLSPLLAASALAPTLVQTPAMLVLSLFVLLYGGFIAVAIWRSADNYRGWIAWRLLAKGSVLLVALQTVAELAGA